MRRINFHKPKVAITVTCILCWIFAYVGTFIWKDYELGLFLVLPFTLGALPTLLIGFKQALEYKYLYRHALYSLFIFCGGLLVFAWEGIICLLMALPMGLILTTIGFLTSFFILRKRWVSKSASIIVLLLAAPTIMSFEYLYSKNETLRSVTTSIEIMASPEKVWQNVVTFPQLKNPTEFIFKTGIAYPTNATIHGHGVGAIRKCNFTTGCFVEPITIWKQPKQLAFDVLQQPAPMKEISFYDIHPAHLNGYWVSQKGQFKLTQLKNGHTLLEGTTWYINKIKPAVYWTLWSDYIVHNIHLRVLEHIKEQSEKTLL